MTYKPLPYGISDFRQIRTESLYFVDKSILVLRRQIDVHRNHGTSRALPIPHPSAPVREKPVPFHAPLLLRHQRAGELPRNVQRTMGSGTSYAVAREIPSAPP